MIRKKESKSILEKMSSFRENQRKSALNILLYGIVERKIVERKEDL